MSETTAAVEAQVTAPAKEAERVYTLLVKVELRVIALREKEGGYSVLIPALPGCFSDADTLEEAAANAVEAAELWLECVHDRRKAEDVREAMGG